MRNINKIGRMIPGVNRTVNKFATSQARNLTSKIPAGMQQRGEQIHNKAMSWVRGKLGYSIENIGGNKDGNVIVSNWPPHHIKPGEVKIPNPKHGSIGDSITSAGEYTGKEFADLEYWIRNYLGNYGEPLLTNKFLVMIYNSPTGKAYKEFTGGTIDNEKIKNMSLFGCRSASFPGKEISTYQWTTHGTEHDYPYISSYDNIDLTFLCTSIEAAERKWFDGWMNEIINTDTMAVGYKDDYVGTITVAILSSHMEKVLEAEIINAYPISVGAIELTHDEGQEIEFTVTFAYDKWKYKEQVPETFDL